MAIAMTAVPNYNVYPPTVVVSVTGITPGDSVLIERFSSLEGVVAVRGGYLASAPSSAVVISDGEFPFGVLIAWQAKTVGATTQYGFVPQQAVSLPGGKVAISDAISGASAEVTVMAWADIDLEQDRSVYRVGGKNVVVSGRTESAQWTANVRLLVQTRSSEMQLRDLVYSATSGVLQMRRSVSDGTLDECYFSVVQMKVERFSADREDQRRNFIMSIVQTDPWPASFSTKQSTLQQLDSYFSNNYALGLLSDLAGAYPTLLAVAQADFS